MTSSEQPSASPDKIPDNRYADIMASWVNNWQSPQRGPLYSGALYRSKVFATLDAERQAAEEPERIAYQHIIDTVSADIVAATAAGSHAEVLTQFREALPPQLAKSNVEAIMTDVFTVALDTIAAQAAIPLNHSS